jgi:hypothetical protein
MGAAEQVETLRQRRAQIDARLAALEARAAADRRKADTRRKVVIGAGVLALAARNPEFGRWLAMRLPEVLAERDRPLVADLGQPPRLSS